ncbi:MAG: histidinol-phosphate transaminase [Saccharofermentanales bacterium]
MNIFNEPIIGMQNPTSPDAAAPGSTGRTQDRRFWNRRTGRLVPYVPGEQPKYRCIKLNTNENPYPPSLNVTAALEAFDPALLRKYPDPGSDILRRTIAGCYDLDAEMIFLGNGSDEVLAFAFQAFFDQERPVAFADVTYSFYPVYARGYEIPYTLIDLEEDFTMPVEAFTAFCGGVVVANPNAPTGICTAIGDIRRILEADRDRLVIVDEAYIDFGGTSAVPLIREFDNLLVIQTTSKSRSLAGLRMGYALGQPSLIQALESVRDSFNSYTIDTIAQHLAAAAFEDSEWFGRTTNAIIATRELMVGRLKEYGFQTLPSSANFIFTTHPDFPASKLYEGLREKGIIVRYFDKPRIDNYLRITVGMPEETEILCNALGQLTKSTKEEQRI